MKATIALVGRPNVGKSTLFNRLIRRAHSITHDMPGVTRDRIYADGSYDGVEYALVDTGGIVMESESVPEASKDFDFEVFDQAREAILEANAILFVVDGREGLNSLDEQAAQYIRESNKPVLLIVNKVDGGELEAEAAADFHCMGFEILPVSAEHGYNLTTLREEVARIAKEWYFPEDEASRLEKGLCISLLGKPNAGKSSIINSILGVERMIVSDVAGTTRDAVDVTYEFQGKRYTFIDTAGVRRRNNITEELERYTVFRALKSSKRADITVFVLDVEEGFSRQDKRLLGYLVSEHIPFLVVINKMDLIEQCDKATVQREYEESLKLAPYVPLLFASSLKNMGLKEILPLAEQIHAEGTIRVGTGMLNRAMQEALEAHQPPIVNRKRAKFYYMTQADAEYPTFIFFVNDPKLVKSSYARYLENKLRKIFRIKYSPLEVVFRPSGESRTFEKSRGITSIGLRGPGHKLEDTEKGSKKKKHLELIKDYCKKKRRDSKASKKKS